METKYIVEFGFGRNKFWLKDAPFWDNITSERNEAKKFSELEKAIYIVKHRSNTNLNGHVTEY